MGQLQSPSAEHFNPNFFYMAYDDGDPGGELTSSTGKNESGGVWDAIKDAAQTGAKIYSTVSGNGSNSNKSSGSSTGSSSSGSKLPSWAVPAAIGGAALVVVLLVLRK